MRPMLHTAAVIPVRSLEGAKSRLGDVLDAEERRDLVTRLLLRTIAAARGAGVDEVLVVSDDAETLEVATAAGATPVAQHRPGLNAGLDEARARAVEGGAAILVVLPADLPLVDAAAVDALVRAVGSGPDPAVVLVPDRHGSGTNALALRGPEVIGFAFGPSSRAAHAALAAEAGAHLVELDSPLAIDLDTPDDLLLVEDRLVGDVA
jgi:2-phospho-L-lactate guanylyltransferase